MKRTLRRLLLVTLIFAVLLSCGCTNGFAGESTEIDTVKLLTPEDIESIFAAISQEVTEKYPIDTDINGSRIVYWLEGGKVWHESRACGSIENAEPEKVVSGSIDDALAAGKERPCKICSADSEYTAADQTDADPSTEEDITVEETVRYPKDYDSSGKLVVYWLEGGKVWHESLSCGSLKGSSSDKIMSGHFDEAIAAGKERPCKICGADSEYSEEEYTTRVPETTEDTTVVLTDKYEKDYAPNGELIVYWLEGGGVWHESRKCPSLSRSDPDKLLSGSEQDAINAGKERVCKNCSK